MQIRKTVSTKTANMLVVKFELLAVRTHLLHSGAQILQHTVLIASNAGQTKQIVLYVQELVTRFI